MWRSQFEAAWETARAEPVRDFDGGSRAPDGGAGRELEDEAVDPTTSA